MRLRVLLWATHFWPHVGGVEVMGAHFVGELARRGHDVTVLTGRDVDELARETEVAGVPVVRVPFRASLERRDADALARLLEQVTVVRRRAAAEVVHLYHVGPDALVYELTKRSVPAVAVATLHGPFPPALLAPTAPVGRVLRGASHVAGCSEATLRAVLEHVPEVVGRGSVIRNALPAIVRPVTESPPCPTLLMLGRVVPQKGFDFGLEAFAAVAKRRPDARLIVAGDGVELPALRERARQLRLESRVSFLGWVRPAEVPALIEDATVVVMPSRYEGFGIVTIEAARCARPVVAFKIAGMPEAIMHDQTGILVPPGDVAAFASAILGLLADPARASALGARARERFLAGDAWDTHVSAYEDRYERARHAALSGGTR